jgi:tetratricopeptide (TPR) repeat protein
VGVDNVKAEAYKNVGNDYFKRNDYSKAVELYTRAVDTSDGKWCEEYM